MKHLQLFEEFGKSKDPIICYKEKDGKFFKQNPKGGDWVECSEKDFKDNKIHEVEPGIFAKKKYNK